MHNNGCAFQVNLLSFSGYYGKSVKEAAFWLAEQGYIDFLGTDLHNMNHVQAISNFLTTKDYTKLISKINIKNDMLKYSCIMFSVMGFMLAGIFIGYFLKQQKKLFKIIGKLNMWIIFLLLFSMGLSIGNNKSIIESLDHFGITAIIIGLAATAGSVLLSIPLYKFLFKRQSDK